MKILQELQASCACALCDTRCRCGDCLACSNAATSEFNSRTTRRLSIAAGLLLVLGGFVYFVPVVTLGATPVVTETISLEVQPAGNSTHPLGSVGYCYLGIGAVLVHGAYYPAVPLNQSARHICQ